MKKIWEWILSLFGGGVPAFKKFADPNKPFMGYMTVNNWSSKDPAKALGLLVEYEVPCAPFEFFENPLAYADTNVKKRLDKFEKWIIEAKKRKINLYVTLYNCNLGNPKTGHPEITGPKCDAQIMAAANQLAKWMKKYSFIYLTPCGEGGIQSKFAAYDTKIQRWCKENMPTAQLVNNWGARPLTKDGMGQLCQHPSKCGPPSIRGAWIMSDHGTFIAYLKTYAAVYRCAKNARENGFAFIMYDYPGDAPMNIEYLKAFRDAQK